MAEITYIEFLLQHNFTFAQVAVWAESCYDKILCEDRKEILKNRIRLM